MHVHLPNNAQIIHAENAQVFIRRGNLLPKNAQIMYTKNAQTVGNCEVNSRYSSWDPFVAESRFSVGEALGLKEANAD
jgi:hypothetical protein